VAAGTYEVGWADNTEIILDSPSQKMGATPEGSPYLSRAKAPTNNLLPSAPRPAVAGD